NMAEIKDKAIQDIQAVLPNSKIVNETLTVSDIIKGMNATKGDPLSGVLATYQVITGKIGSEMKMKTFSDTKAEFGWYGSNDTDKNMKTTYASTTQLQVSQDHDSILKIKANENIMVNLTHPALTSWIGSNGKYSITVVTNNKSCLMKETFVSDNHKEANYYFDGVSVLHLRKGDTLYLSLSTTNEWYFYADIMPVISMSKTGYNESMTVGVLLTNRTSNKKIMDDTLSSLSEKNYSVKNWADIKSIVDTAKASIDEQISVSKIVEIRKKAIQDINKILPNSKINYEVLAMDDMIGGMNQTKGEAYKSSLVTYQLLSGKFGKEIKMNHFSLDGDIGHVGVASASECWYTPPGVKDSQAMAVISETALQAVDGYDAIIKLTINKPGELRITHPQLTGWRPDYTKIKLIRVRNGKTVVLSDKYVSSLTSPANAYTPDVGAVKANDIIYLVYYTTNEYYGSVSLSPVIEIGNIPAKDTTEFIDLNGVIADSIAGNGCAVNTNSTNFEFMYGKIGSMSKFNAHDAKAIWNTGKTASFAGNGTITAGPNTSSIIKITAKKKTAFCFSSDISTLTSGSKLTIYQETNGVRYQIKEATKDFTAKVSANIGDIIYFVFSSTKSAAKCKLSGALTTDTEQYNIYERPNELKQETYSLSDMVAQAMFSKSSGEQMRYLSTFELLYGSLDTQTVPLKVNDTLPNTLSDDSASTTISKNQLKAGMLGNDAIIKITAKKDMKISITHPEITYLWPGNTGVKMIAESDGIRITLKDNKMSNALKGANYYLKDVHMKAGDILYIVYYSTDSYYGIIDMLPTFRFDTTAYNSSMRAEFDEIKRAKALITEKSEALTAYLESLDKNLYSTVNWLEMEEIVEEAQSVLSTKTTVTEINKVYDQAISDLKAVLTIEQVKAQLSELKNSKVSKLNEFVASLNKESYSVESWKAFESIQSKYVGIIQDSTNTTSVEVAFETAKAAILKIEKGSSGDTPADVPEKPGGNAIYIIIAAGVVAVLL
ncbi:MAG: hypothetical protein N2Z65_03480, partial [Clostridiales bacterium]|nr:hypothetical protein [Clostridiales bacterium]